MPYLRPLAGATADPKASVPGTRVAVAGRSSRSAAGFAGNLKNSEDISADR